MRIIEIEQLKKVLQALPDNPRIVVSGNFAPPMTLLGILDSVLPTYRLHMLNAQPGIPDREGVTHESAFIGAGMRKSSRLDYVPSRLSLLPVLLRDHLRPDVVLLHTTTPRFDTVSLGIEVNILPAAIEAVRAYGGVVIAQGNSQMPYTYGDSQIYDSEIDFLVEVDEPLKIHAPGELSDTSRQIGERIAALVEDSSTLQLGRRGGPVRCNCLQCST